MNTYATLQQDSKLRFKDGDATIVTKALGRIPGNITAILDFSFDRPEDFDAHLHHAMRHGGTLIVEQHLDDVVTVYGVRFSGPFMTVLSPEELKQYRSGVNYGSFDDFLH
jgi:hypothetical protein